MFITLLLSSLIAIIVSFLCSLAEALLLNINPLDLNRLRKHNPDVAEAWSRLKKNISRPIAAILILNTIAHTGGATVAGGAFLKLYGENSIWIFSIFFTVIILFGTEILPKIIGVAFRKQLAPYVGNILEITTHLLKPLIALSEFLFHKLVPQHDPEQITTSDLITLASLAKSGKFIGLEQENIIVNTIRLNHTLVHHVMIPADQIHFIKEGDTAEGILDLACKTLHSRYPISRTRESKDIHAFINIKRAIPLVMKEIPHIIANAKPIRKISEQDTLLAALKLMIQHKEHLLAVCNAKNECIGILTLEDIASELFGADIEQFK